MLNDEKQIKGSKYILGAFIIVAVLIIAFHLLGRTGISDNGNRTNNTGKQLQQLGTNHKSSLEKSEKLQQELEISLNKQEQLEKECYRLESKLLISLEKSERQEKSLKKVEKSLPPSDQGSAGSRDKD